MRYGTMLSIVALLLVFTGLSGIGFAKKHKSDFTPEIQGMWAGKLQVKAFGLGEDGAREKDAQALTFDIKIDQQAITIDAVYATDEGPETFHLKGVAGNNSFWASGTDEDGSETVTFSGHIDGHGDQLKGIGVETAADEVSELRFDVKRG